MTKFEEELKMGNFVTSECKHCDRLFGHQVITVIIVLEMLIGEKYLKMVK